MATCTTEYFAGYGKVFVAPRAKGGAINGGWTELGDTENLQVNTSQTWQEVRESCSGTRSVAARYITESNWEFTVDAKSFSKENLARAFYGTSSAVTGGTVNDEAVKAYALNQIIPLKNPGVSAVTVSKGVTPLVPDQDYKVDAANGTITIISATNVGTFPVDLTVDYTFASYDKVETGTETFGEYAFRFEGTNATTGKTVIAEVHRVALDMAAALSLISIEPATFTMAGMVMPDSTAGVGESQYVTIKKAQ